MDGTTVVKDLRIQLVGYAPPPPRQGPPAPVDEPPGTSRHSFADSYRSVHNQRGSRPRPPGRTPCLSHAAGDGGDAHHPPVYPLGPTCRVRRPAEPGQRGRVDEPVGHFHAPFMTSASPRSANVAANALRSATVSGWAVITASCANRRRRYSLWASPAGMRGRQTPRPHRPERQAPERLSRWHLSRFAPTGKDDRLHVLAIDSLWR